MAISISNIFFVSASLGRSPEAFRVVDGSRIQVQSLPAELLLKVKHIFFGGWGAHLANIYRVLREDQKVLEGCRREEFIDPETQECKDIFLSIQRFNQALMLSRDPRLKKGIPLLSELARGGLCFERPILPASCPEMAPLSTGEVEVSSLLGVPEEQYPHIHVEGRLLRHRVFHYDEADVHVNHGKEALQIFLSTQVERIKSLVGRVLEGIARHFFRREASFFRESHYFRNKEDERGEIVVDEPPLSMTLNPSSYWVGHATCMFNVSAWSEKGERIGINIVSDPVEGDLQRIFYPRMTPPARRIDECPIPHLFLLSHNHLDHYDAKAIAKLKKYQPIVLVPEGDGPRLRKAGLKRVYELNWWQTARIPVEQGEKKGELQITAVPARHWSGQGVCDGHRSAFLGYVIHQAEGDLYFAGDTARLSDAHIATLREKFDIRSMFQPGGPDEMRSEMESTHQSSADGLLVHCLLMVQRLYDQKEWGVSQEFVEAACALRTVYTHTKTYKLGNLHFDDTEESVRRVKEALLLGEIPEGMKPYEREIYHQLLEFGERLRFREGGHLSSWDIFRILDSGVSVPQIGSRTELGTKI